MPFNPGDRVRCIRPSDQGNAYGVMGQEYTVHRHAGPTLYIVELTNFRGEPKGCISDRFELIPAAPQGHIAADRFILWNAAGHYHNVQGRHSYTHDEAVAIAQEALAIDGTRVLHLVPLRSVHVFQR